MVGMKDMVGRAQSRLHHQIIRNPPAVADITSIFLGEHDSVSQDKMRLGCGCGISA